MAKRTQPRIDPPETTGAPTLCLNMIVKNEVDNLPRCLEAVADHIACWVICDTGSTDGTQNLIRDFFKRRGIPGELHSVPFENFEQARNEALAYAEASPLAFDYLLLCDADMELVVEDRDFRKGLEAPGYSMPQVTGINYWNTRLARRGIGARYHGVTHEYIAIPGGVGKLREAWFKDHASGSNRVDKIERDIRLLTEALKREPGNARYWFYLAQTYRDGNRMPEAIEAYAKRAEMGGFAEEAWYALLQQARCLKRMGDEGGFLRVALAAFNRRPHRAEPLYELARHYRTKGMNEAAVLFAEAGMKLPYPAQDILFIENFVYDIGLREEFGISAYYSGDPARRDRGFAATDWLALYRNTSADRRELARANSGYYIRPAAETMRSFAAQPVGFVPPDGYRAMNPAVTRMGDQLFLVQRAVNFTVTDGRYETAGGESANTRNFLLRLDRDLRIESSAEILPPADLPVPQYTAERGFEYLRPFAWRGELWCTATVRELNADGWCEQVLARIAEAGSDCRLTDWRVLRPDGPRRHEKNWMPQVSGNRLQFVYSCDPTRLVDDKAQTLAETVPLIAAEHFRGGSHAIPFFDGWLAVVHEVNRRDGKQFYHHRFVWFDAQNVLRAVSRPFYLRQRGIEFVAGLSMHPDGKRLVMSFGMADGEAWIATVDAEEVGRMVRAVASLPPGPQPAAPASWTPQPAQPQPAQATNTSPRPAASSARGRKATTKTTPRGQSIFLHSSFRTSSTWFWGRFRQSEDALCFWEPFHESNEWITRAEAQSWNSKSWASGHPRLDPYWLEYLPLIRRSGGVRLYDRRMPYDWFVPEGGLRGDLRPTEKRYLALAFRLAARQGKVPVLGLNQGLGRIAALKNTFGGTHIFLHRNLVKQWLSYLYYYAHNVNIFYYSTGDIVTCPGDDAYLAGLQRDFLHRLPGDASKGLRKLRQHDAFSLFMAVHVYLYLHAKLVCTVEADVTAMALDPAHRNGLEREISACTGVAVTFDDVRDEPSTDKVDIDLAAADWPGIREYGLAAARALKPYGDEAQLVGFANKLIDAAFAEMQNLARPPATRTETTAQGSVPA